LILYNIITYILGYRQIVNVEHVMTFTIISPDLDLMTFWETCFK